MHQHRDRLRAAVEQQGLADLGARMVERVGAETDEAARQEDLLADDSHGVDAVADNVKDNDLAIRVSAGLTLGRVGKPKFV